MDSSVAPKTYKLDEKTREQKREYMRRYRAANPVKAKADAAAWYQANRERINEPKRRAHFEANERDRERKCKLKGIPFVARAYTVYETDDPRISEHAIEKAKAFCVKKEV